jgi:hypothetical protein
MKNIFVGLLIVLFAGCATTGVTTLYKTQEKVSIKTIGFADLCNDSSLTKLFPPTNDIFKQTLPIAFEEFGMKDVQHLDDRFQFQMPDTEAIKSACQKNNLDAILITNLKFINVSMRRGYGRMRGQADHHTEVDMKLFDKTGKLLFDEKYNTYYGNTYDQHPTARITIHDGTRGGVIAIMNDINPNAKSNQPNQPKKNDYYDY